MGSIKPTWTDNIALINVELNPGDDANASRDMRTEEGMLVFISLGRLANSSVDGAMKVSVRRAINNDGSFVHAGELIVRTMNTTTADGNTTVDSDSAADQRVLSVASTTNFAAGDKIYIGATDGTLAEFNEVATLVAGVSLILMHPLKNAHTALAADAVINQADVFPEIWVPGGSLVEIDANYNTASAAPDMWVQI